VFAGHAAVAALAGSTRPSVPVLPLVLAAYAADALEIAYHTFGVSHSGAMQWSHSITAMFIGGTAFGLVVLAVLRRRDAAVLAGLVYASHWVCDLLTGENKPTWVGGPSLGFGLYQLPAADFVVEVLLVVAAAVLYQWRRPTQTRRVVLATAVLVMLQLGFNLGDRAHLHGLKRNLVRATSAAVLPVTLSSPADPS
jgi:hypothetical protein